MYSQREIACIALHEKVVHLDDFLLRRSLLVMSGELTYDLVVKVREVIGDALGWSADVCQAEVERVLELLVERYGITLNPTQA